MQNKRSGYIVESLMIIIVIIAVVSMLQAELHYGTKRGNEKLTAVREYFTNMRTAFDNNISFSCMSEKAQLIENNMSKLNGYTMEYDDNGVTQNITFTKGKHFFTGEQCESIGLLLWTGK